MNTWTQRTKLCSKECHNELQRQRPSYRLGTESSYKGKKHHNWQGDKVNYLSLHKWVSRHKGKPQECEHCNNTSDQKYHWANKSHEYKRILSDWIRLCVPCHSAYDRKAVV